MISASEFPASGGAPQGFGYEVSRSLSFVHRAFARFLSPSRTRQPATIVIPAKAGIHFVVASDSPLFVRSGRGERKIKIDSGFRRNDGARGPAEDDSFPA
ncbi:hypothetical protein GLE_3220 [Lysobacter enzymogenes]|uniref:Uncharacterized protein n=1 Tax=Lysobacter enzymogenes TaxID=69 RepID=A0A0S2DIT6_LYSEN|nr:hypothetical protein [Lysobacter enzymogenes]ALN58566.1 hypothetical protein GLE_3220 [Lysobacter enzymogenes]